MNSESESVSSEDVTCKGPVVRSAFSKRKRWLKPAKHMPFSTSESEEGERSDKTGKSKRGPIKNPSVQHFSPLKVKRNLSSVCVTPNSGGLFKPRGSIISKRSRNMNTIGRSTSTTKKTVKRTQTETAYIEKFKLPRKNEHSRDKHPVRIIPRCQLSTQPLQKVDVAHAYSAERERDTFTGSRTRTKRATNRASPKATQQVGKETVLPGALDFAKYLSKRRRSEHKRFAKQKSVLHSRSENLQNLSESFETKQQDMLCRATLSPQSRTNARTTREPITSSEKSTENDQRTEITGDDTIRVSSSKYSAARDLLGALISAEASNHKVREMKLRKIMERRYGAGNSGASESSSKDDERFAHEDCNESSNSSLSITSEE